MAKGAGCENLQVVGQTENNIILRVPTTEGEVSWLLSQCLIIQNLGCDVLIGEPAKIYNDIVTHPSHKLATSIDNKKKPVTIPYIDNYSEPVASSIKKVTVYPNQNINIDVPCDLKSQKQVLIEPVDSSFPQHGIYNVKNGKISLCNKSDHAISVNSTVHMSALMKIYNIA